MEYLLIIKLLLVVAISFGSASTIREVWNWNLRDFVNYQDENEHTCGYDYCNLGKKDMINIHLVSHTHDDVGWLKTVDQYFYGDKTSIQRAGVQYILDSVVAQLEKDPTRRFIYVEIAFFYRWWLQQTKDMQTKVRKLVNEGRFEFILGGWCMNDEASTHYTAIIDQHTLGLRFLQDNFGECGRPRVAWQIDPFGHSREQASLFAQMGYDGLFFARIDYQDKEARKKDKSLEMIWHGSENLVSELFTGAFFDFYGPPSGLNFDDTSGDSPVMDDKRMHGYNVDDFVKLVEMTADAQLKGVKTTNLLFLMGSDFQYQNANTWYKNLDKLIKYVNAKQTKGGKVNLLYSTPSCYLLAQNKANVTWPTKSDDFFPYADNAHSFWTGYFTSRPALKDYVRKTNVLLQATKQISVLAKLDSTKNENIEVLKRAMGVAQHHDAVSGTEKQAVAYDYAERLAEGVAQAEDVLNDGIRVMQTRSGGHAVPHQTFCPLLNITKCSFTETNTQFIVTIYNARAHNRSTVVRIPVSNDQWTVIDAVGREVPFAVEPITERTKNIPERNESIAKYEVIFEASVPALGFTSFYLNAKKQIKNMPTYSRNIKIGEGAADFHIGNKFITLYFDGNTGLLKQMIKNKDNSTITLDIEQKLMYYKAFQGNNSLPEFKASGAYAFRPDRSTPFPFTDKICVEGSENDIVKEVRQKFSDWATQVIRLYNDRDHVEIEWTVGPIFIDDKQGREVISLYKTNLKTEKLFYTDSNGREILVRKRDFRPTWKLNQTEDVAGNYYPVNSRIFIRDEVSKQVQLTILTDRTQGGASINDGEIELMLHRRLLDDDAYGVGEALNEKGSDGKGLIVKGKHYLILDDMKSAGRHQRDLGMDIFYSPIISFAPTSMTSNEWLKSCNTEWSALKNRLPRNVNLLTLEKWRDNTILLRLEHFFEKGEDPELSKMAIVDLNDLFKGFTINTLEELMLGANQKISDSKRLEWKSKETSGGFIPYNQKSYFEADNTIHGKKLVVVLKPMMIRTFQVTVE